MGLTRTIAGTVTDATSLVLPGVTVEVRSTVAGGPAQTVFTDGTGTFTLTALPAGTYDVIFILPGFSTVVRGGVAISAGATTTLDVEMAVQLEERVVVVGSRAQPRSATASAVPVDVISPQEFASQGATDLTDTLRTVVPSFNVNTRRLPTAVADPPGAKSCIHLCEEPIVIRRAGRFCTPPGPAPSQARHADGSTYCRLQMTERVARLADPRSLGAALTRPAARCG